MTSDEIIDIIASLIVILEIVCYDSYRTSVAKPCIILVDEPGL